MPAELTQIKRKRGGQKGNQNARSHGFYSSALTPVETGRLQDVLSHQSIDPEMAALCVKLQSAVEQSGADCHTLKEVGRLILKRAVQKHPLDRKTRAFMKEYIETHLEQCSGISLR